MAGMGILTSFYNNVQGLIPKAMDQDFPEENGNPGKCSPRAASRGHP
jgi:hypothetical protein